MAVDERVTSVACRPRYDGANIRTWIGFKEFLSLGAEAVLEWFRERGLGPRRLYHEFGLGLEVVSSAAQLPAVLEIDNDAVAEVVAKAPGTFQVRLRVAREGVSVVVMRGTLRVVLVRRPESPRAESLPPEFAPLIVSGLREAGSAAELPDLPIDEGVEPHSVLAPPGSRAFHWSWRARYFHCHDSDRVQHSAYVGALEEVVDRFLDARGLSIGRMLSVKGWIPVVSRARVRMIDQARLGERIETTFEVVDMLGRLAYDSEMRCYVRRDGLLVPTAEARILHGYALSRGPEAGRLVELDEPTLAALRGNRP
jgi:acyl-CoA thioesterase FadM